jgi:ubiquinone biosynthesis monooxygenase Coq7
MLRVDHAGELGADRIYHGQSFVLNKDPKYAPIIQNMWNQEKEHLEEMEYMNLKYRTRKSLLESFWSIGGFVMGSVTALMGPKAAMACTVAVEHVITQHYNDQIRDIVTEGDIQESQYMLDKFSKFRDDEQHHHDTAQEHGQDEKETEANPNLSRAIDLVCRASIKIAEKV